MPSQNTHIYGIINFYCTEHENAIWWKSMCINNRYYLLERIYSKDQQHLAEYPLEN